MRSVKWFAAVLVLPLVVGEVTADEPKSELDVLQGTWVVESVEIDGQQSDVFAGLVSVIQGDTITSQHGPVTSTAKLKLDPKSKPHKLDSSNAEGDTTKAIYVLRGNTLLICAAVPGAARPTEFATRKSLGHMLFVYKRKQ